MTTNAAHTTEQLKLGYIGLGNMGAPMATRMTEWPGGVTVYDIRIEAMTPLAEAGATLADSVADVAAADLIHITVLDDARCVRWSASWPGTPSPAR